MNIKFLCIFAYLFLLPVYCLTPGMCEHCVIIFNVLECLPLKCLHPTESVIIMKIFCSIAVIGFENANEQVKENVGAAQEINVQTITPFAQLESTNRNAMLAVTVQVNQGLSTATFGSPY